MGNSRGSLSSLHQEFVEKDSVVFSVRVRITDLASMCEFMITSGFPPKSGGHALSQALVMFTESLVAHDKAKRYELQEAKRLCENVGVATGSRRNVRTFGCQVEPTRPNVLTPEQVKEALALLKQYQDPIVSENECTIPKNEDELLNAMEMGKPNVAEDE
jgi:hypothetical protein